jgi:hypothetical protein
VSQTCDVHVTAGPTDWDGPYTGPCGLPLDDHGNCERLDHRSPGTCRTCALWTAVPPWDPIPGVTVTDTFGTCRLPDVDYMMVDIDGEGDCYRTSLQTFHEFGCNRWRAK